MNLKFICSEGFEIAAEICHRVQGYLPNLIDEIEIIRTDAFTRILYTWEVLPLVERTVEPDWENDIVLVKSDGELYLADVEVHGVTHVLDPLVLKEDGTTKLTSERPKLGVHFLPINMVAELRGDGEHWAKLGVEGFLWYFGIPRQHDANCFFLPKGSGERITMKDRRKDFCPKCQKFMLQLEAPLDFAKLSSRVAESYGLTPKPRRRWGGILQRLRQG